MKNSRVLVSSYEDKGETNMKPIIIRNVHSIYMFVLKTIIGFLTCDATVVSV